MMDRIHTTGPSSGGSGSLPSMTPISSQPAPSSSNVPPIQASSTNPASSSSGGGNAGGGTTSGGPQIRSRITVVCAECKRLKLKCDRKSPCGSCTKRDTVARCLYSQAATEKVDMHSMNNRVMNMELALARLLAGREPDYVPTHPPVLEQLAREGIIPNASAATGTSSASVPTTSTVAPLAAIHPSHHEHGHVHHHHQAAPSSTSQPVWKSIDLTLIKGFHDIAVSFREQLAPHIEAEMVQSDFEMELIDEEEGGGDVSTNINIVKSESSHGYSDGDTIMLSTSPSEISFTTPSLPKHIPNPTAKPTLPSIINAVNPSPSTPSLQQQQRYKAQLLLPPQSIYYPDAPVASPGSSAASSSAFPAVPQHVPFSRPSSGFDASAAMAISSTPLYLPNTPGPTYTHRPHMHSISDTSFATSSGSTSMGPPSTSPSAPFPGRVLQLTTTPKPVITPALQDLLPSASICAKYLEAAREVLRGRPVELGLPVGLRSKAKSKEGLVSAWDAFMKRCKRVYARKQISSSSSSSSSRKGKSKEVDVAVVGSSERVHRERATSSGKKSVKDTPDLERLKAIYYAGVPSSRRAPSPTTDGPPSEEDDDRSVSGLEKRIDPRKMGKIIRERTKLVSGSASVAESPSVRRVSASTPVPPRSSSRKPREGESPLPPTPSTSAPPTTEESLTFFALMCALMAIGAAKCSTSQVEGPKSVLGRTDESEPKTGTATPAFLYALSQQALGVWLENGQQEASTSPTASTSDGSKYIGGKEERIREERTEYLRTCLVGIGYLMGNAATLPITDLEASSFCHIKGADRQAVLSLVGKMVTALRTWGIEDSLFSTSSFSAQGASPHDGPSSTLKPAKKTVSSKQREKVKLTAQETLVAESASVKNKKAPGWNIQNISQLPEKEAESTKGMTATVVVGESREARKRVLWDVLFYDFYISEAFGEPPLAPDVFYDAPLPSMELQPIPLTTEEAKPGDEKVIEEASALRLERVYLASRAHLTRLSHAVKARISSPDCCCGYTLDQATRLEAEVKRWLADMPPELRWAFKLGVKGSSSALAGRGKDIVSGDDVDSDSGESDSEIEVLSDREMMVDTQSNTNSSRDVSAAGDDARKSKSARIVVKEEEEPPLVQGIWQEHRKDRTRNRVVRKLMSCELVLAVQLLVIKVYAPFVAPLTNASRSTSDPAETPLPALQNFLSASQSVIRIGSIMKGLITSRLTLTAKAELTPMLLHLNSLHELVFDATVVSARVYFGTASSSDPSSPSLARSMGMTGRDRISMEVMQSIGLGLDFLESAYGIARFKVQKGKTSSSRGSADKYEEQVKTIRSIRQQWSEGSAHLGSSTRLKRKRSLTENDVRSSTTPKHGIEVNRPEGDDDDDDDDMRHEPSSNLHFDVDHTNVARPTNFQDGNGAQSFPSPQVGPLSKHTTPTSTAVSASPPDSANSANNILDIVLARVEVREGDGDGSSPSPSSTCSSVLKQPMLGIRVRKDHNGKPLPSKRHDSAKPTPKPVLPVTLTSEAILGYGEIKEKPRRLATAQAEFLVYGAGHPNVANSLSPPSVTAPPHHKSLRSRSASLSHVQTAEQSTLSMPSVYPDIEPSAYSNMLTYNMGPDANHYHPSSTPSHGSSMMFAAQQDVQSNATMAYNPSLSPAQTLHTPPIHPTSSSRGYHDDHMHFSNEPSPHSAGHSNVGGPLYGRKDGAAIQSARPSPPMYNSTHGPSGHSISGNPYFMSGAQVYDSRYDLAKGPSASDMYGPSPHGSIIYTDPGGTHNMPMEANHEHAWPEQQLYSWPHQNDGGL